MQITYYNKLPSYKYNYGGDAVTQKADNYIY